MRECGSCQECCNGLLSGSARGSFFGNLKKCTFLKNSCEIYDERPGTCRRFFCAWAQELLPEWMRPDMIKTIVNVEVDEAGKQYLNAISSDNIEEKVLQEINNFTIKNNSYFKSTKIYPLKVQYANFL